MLLSLQYITVFCRKEMTFENKLKSLPGSQKYRISFKTAGITILCIRKDVASMIFLAFRCNCLHNINKFALFKLK